MVWVQLVRVMIGLGNKIIKQCLTKGKSFDEISTNADYYKINNSLNDKH